MSNNYYKNKKNTIESGSGAGGMGAEFSDNLLLNPVPEPVANMSSGVEGAKD